MSRRELSVGRGGGDADVAFGWELTPWRARSVSLQKKGPGSRPLLGGQGALCRPKLERF